MKKLKLLLVTATMLGGMMFTHQSQAQNGPCGWTLNLELNQPTCYKVCNGSISVSPTVNWPDFEYLWSNGSTLPSIANLCEDEYTVTVTDDKKCSQSYTYSIIEPAQLIASCLTLSDESIAGAADGSIEASAVGGTGSHTFEWQTNPVSIGALLSGVSAGNYTVIVYDGNDCTATTSCDVAVDKKGDCTGFRTQTMGGWGQCHLTGNNPGTYLFANFALAFPNGLTVGCTRTLTLTSAQAVCEFLPSTTGPKALPVGATVDPGQSLKNVFAGQLVAATINVEFDKYDANFASNSEFTLEDLIITSGLFEGYSVKELLVEAGKKIGGCGSLFTHGELSDALALVNENYKDGIADKGFLKCPEKLECGQLRTQTQGGWGQCHQNGYNPGTYLFANFGTAFQNGLTIGCNRTLKLTSASAVCEFLPSTTTPKALPAGHLVDPGQTYKNVFAGQLVTAVLNVGFDINDDDFGLSEVQLRDMIIGSGLFEGWKVKDLIAEANRKIGGCGSVYSHSQLSSALAQINQNYVGGTIDKGFLVCPGSIQQTKVVDLDKMNLMVNIYPNPMNDVSNISIHTPNDEMLIVEVYNISGQRVSSLFNGEVQGGTFTDLVIDANTLTTGLYIVKVTTNNNVQINKIVVNK